jgi:riboflavin kinase/FMN adenylyltransferase
MQVITDITSIPALSSPVITIGSFDGLHIGHMHILQQIKEEAQKTGGHSVVITFHPHPKLVVGQSESPLKMLTTINEKIKLLEAMGIDYLFIVPFTENFSQMSANNYITDFLVRYFKPKTIVIGYDHRFGVDRSGGLNLLESYASKGFFKVQEIPEQIIRENAISSSLIRRYLQEGDIEKANTLLGRPYFLNGQVIEGKKLGRTIGFPTANIEISEPEKLIPAVGVYAVLVRL